ncbi:hypothetical protein TNCV_3647541 [Trichonephila clavipes]|nr:hypothetical protein TNCV_3647541 [Trichonephila clavipes]
MASFFFLLNEGVIALACQITDGHSSRKLKGCPASFQAQEYGVVDDVDLSSLENHVLKIVSNYKKLEVISEVETETTVIETFFALFDFVAAVLPRIALKLEQ